MTLTKLTYLQEKNKYTMSSARTKPHDAEQILYLKRLIVTLKQQFEKNLHELNEELHVEQLRNQSLQNELDTVTKQLEELTSLHEDEIKALREQQLALRDLLKKAQNDQPKSIEEDSISAPEGVNIELELLKQEIEIKQRKILELEAQLENEKSEAAKELNHLKNTLNFFEEQDAKQELITSNTSSYQLRQELELIKQTLVQGMQETKSIETRYADLFHEKMNLEHQIKQLQSHLENQSHLSDSLQLQINELVLQKSSLETTLQEKESQLASELKNCHELNNKMIKLEEKCRMQDLLQEKYEQLKEEHIHLSRNLEETIQLRLQAELQLEKIDSWAEEQSKQFSDKCQEASLLIEERDHLQAEIQHLHELLTDAESRLKVAQQHLAKKVKESALLVERVDEQQNNITDYLQFIETAKSQITQLQTSIEHYQKQEQKLQEQLHDALKGTESQVAKWEKKYFEMCDKWQESENQSRKLRKFEEKHLQMQNLLANLGNFMGSSISPGQLFNAMQEEQPPSVPDPVMPLEGQSDSSENSEIMEDKYDLFGMRHVPERYNSNVNL
jgi:chromosome segregation ATPase